MTWLIFLVLISFLTTCKGNSLVAEDRCPLFEYRCLNNKCIPDTFKCDGKNDCGDKSDEMFCDDDKYHCSNGATIERSQLCDGIDNCKEDEDVNTCKVYKCRINEYMCSTGPMNCVAFSAVCNNHNDCKDSSDESPGACELLRQSKIVECDLTTSYRCQDKTMCVSKLYVCDNNRDCADGSDESLEVCKAYNRTNNGMESHNDNHNSNELGTSNDVSNKSNSCSKDDFYCGDKSISGCISKAWYCDNSIDCEGTGLDEMNCPNFKCPYDRPNKCLSEDVCYHDRSRCDGIFDCADSSDEHNCNHNNQLPVQCDVYTQFICVKINKCIMLSALCDKNNDCGDGADERPGGNPDNCKLNACAVNNGGCEQLCSNYFTETKCHCNNGYRISLSDPHKCIDIDECKEQSPPCSHHCINTPGSYQCQCYPGFYQSPSNNSLCLAVGEKFLLYNSNNSIREYRILHHHMDNLLMHNQQKKKQNTLPIGIDYEYRSGRVFFSTFRPLPQIVMLEFDKSNQYQQKVLRNLSSSHQPVGISFDWIHKLLFWTDIYSNEISVINISQSKQSKTLIKLSASTKLRSLVVHPGYRRIYFTDWGLHPKIESISMDGSDRQILVQTNMKTPNGLAIDFYKDDLYWVDAKDRSINCINLKTKHIRSVVSYMDSHGFDLDVFEDWLYLSDWNKHRIVQIHKISGQQKTLLKSPHPMGIKIRHELAQRSDYTNVCNNNTCEKLCLPIAISPDIHRTFRCDCPDSSHLLDNQVSCSPIYDSDPGKKSVIPNSAKIQKFSGEKQHRQTASLVIGFVAAIVFIVLIAAITICLVIYRNYMHRVIKQSTNFNNPAYFHKSPTSEIQMINCERSNNNLLNYVNYNHSRDIKDHNQCLIDNAFNRDDECLKMKLES